LGSDAWEVSASGVGYNAKFSDDDGYSRGAEFGYSNTSDDADFLKSSWKAESPAVMQKPSRPH